MPRRGSAAPLWSQQLQRILLRECASWPRTFPDQHLGGSEESRTDQKAVISSQGLRWSPLTFEARPRHDRPATPLPFLRTLCGHCSPLFENVVTCCLHKLLARSLSLPAPAQNSLGVSSSSSSLTLSQSSSAHPPPTTPNRHTHKVIPQLKWQVHVSGVYNTRSRL